MTRTIYYSEKDNHMNLTSPKKSVDIRTVSGKEIDLNEFSVTDFNLHDAIHSLSMQCRYNGHVEHFYSVLEHQIVVSGSVSPELRFRALVHDIAEYLISDLITPIKDVCPRFRELESHIESKVFSALGLPKELPNFQEIELKSVDSTIRVLEINTLSKIPAPERLVMLSGETKSNGSESFEGYFNELRSIYMNHFNELKPASCKL